MENETREKLIAIIEQVQREAKGAVGSMNNGFAAWYADKLLEADVVPVVHGEWVAKYGCLVCSVCKSGLGLGTGERNYCPNCGAVMRKGTE